MNEHYEQVPAEALRFQASSELLLGDSKEGDRSSPFKMLARTGKPVEHFYFGKVVHDFAGMRMPGGRSKIAVDFNHDPDTIIGYANHFNSESGDLEIAGALTPTEHNSKATEVIALAQQGVPFEASIQFGGGDGLTIEKVAAGQVAEVNGTTFSGPGTVIREWTLTGVAVTPYGHDSNTFVEFSRASGKTCEILVKETEMSDNNTEALAEATAAVDPQQVNDSKQVAEAPDAVEATQKPIERPSEATTGQQFMDAFGEAQGAIYFAKGLSFEQANAAEVQRLRGAVDDLTTRMAEATQMGESAPVSHSTATKTEKKKDDEVDDFKFHFDQFKYE